MFVMFGRRQVRPPSGSGAVMLGRPSGSAALCSAAGRPSGSGGRQVRPHSVRPPSGSAALCSAAVRFGRRHVPPHPVGPHLVRPAVRLGRRQVRPHPVGPPSGSAAHSSTVRFGRRHVRAAVMFGVFTKCGTSRAAWVEPCPGDEI